MTKDSQELMKERFDGLISQLMEAGLFLEQAVEILEKGMIERSLVMTSANQSEAAKMLGIHRNTLQRKMVEHNINGKRPRRKPPLKAERKETRPVRRSRVS